MSDAYDALVIGGGPGGSATAFHLARGGARVLLAEKQTYPRDKVCGDGLTPRAVRALDHMGLREEYQSWSRSAGLKVHGGGHVIELPWPELEDYPSFGLARPRADLDQLLARTAAKAGADLWESTDVVEPLVENGLVRGAVVRREGEDPVDVRAEVVVAADGASSRFAQALGLVRDDHRPIGVAIRQYFRSDRDTDPWIDSYLELWKGDHLLPGYGWVFPLADGTVNVGCGLLNTSEGFRNTNYRDLLKGWLPTVAAEWDFDPADPVAKPRSAPLPMGASRHPPLHRGVLFVGDAAGLVNPFNGEGIDYAMESGQLAAEVGLAVLESGDRTRLSTYRAALERSFGSYFTLGRVFVRAIGHPQVMKACARYGLPRPTLMKLVLKLMANLYEPARGDATDRIVRAMVRLAPSR
ncbi:MAG TPA: geranylgeranyl reductase family protein [Actinomycetota bacterium]|nr:geranylgeranyl reductase family protein [Actinomycetota bacterium]